MHDPDPRLRWVLIAAPVLAPALECVHERLDHARNGLADRDGDLGAGAGDEARCAAVLVHDLVKAADPHRDDFRHDVRVHDDAAAAVRKHSGRCDLHAPLEPMQAAGGVGLALVDLALWEDVDPAALLDTLDGRVDCGLVDSAAADRLDDLSVGKEL